MHWKRNWCVRVCVHVGVHLARGHCGPAQRSLIAGVGGAVLVSHSYPRLESD